MQKIIFLKGLPGSGKTTFAKELIADNPKFCRINKDDIREKLGNPKWSKKFEKEVLKEQREMGNSILKSGYSLIVDDTNFSSKHKIYWEEIAKNMGIEFEEKYIDTPVDVCVDRDLHRKKSVGSDVIRQMYKRYVKHSISRVDTRFIVKQDKNLPKCIICDIDGTLALINGRNPYDDTLIHTDKLNEYVASIVKSKYNDNTKVFIMSGRMTKCKEQTATWLKNNGILYDELLMRKTDDFRQDAIIKKELFDNNIKNKYFVEFWLDDRDQVVKMVREELGLLCLQVYYGNF